MEWWTTSLVYHVDLIISRPALLISWFPMWERGEYIAGRPPAGISTGASKVELDKDCFFFPSTSMLGFGGRASDLKKKNNITIRQKKKS